MLCCNSTRGSLDPATQNTYQTQRTNEPVTRFNPVVEDLQKTQSLAITAITFLVKAMNLSLTRDVPVTKTPVCGNRSQSRRFSTRQVRARATETEREHQERAAAEIDDAKPSGIGQPGGTGKPSVEGLDSETQEKGKRLAKVVSPCQLVHSLSRPVPSRLWMVL